MKNLKKKMVEIWRDESAQGMTEYILILAVIVAIGVMFSSEIKGVLESKISELSGKIGGFGN